MQSLAATSTPHYTGLATERNRRLGRSIVSALLTKPLAVIVPLVTVPMLLRYLGTERYGLLETVTAITAWIGLTNAGLGMGLMNQLTDCFVSGNRTLARQYVSTVFYATAGLMVTAALVLLPVILIVDWSALFRMRVPLKGYEMTLTLILTLVLSILTVFTSILSPIYSAYQELPRYNIWDAVAKFSAFVGCLIVLGTPFGLTGALIALFGFPVAVRFANLACLFAFEKPWLRPSLQFCSWSALKPITKQGLCFFALQIACVVVFNTDKLIISSALDMSAVADYAVVGRFFLMAYGVYLMILMPLWPACGEALRIGDLDWIRMNLRRSLWIGCGGFAALGVLMLWQGNTIASL
jgi:O-antigen/teichoic acid export membrane protein